VYQGAEKTLLSLGSLGLEALGTLLSDRDAWVRARAAAALVAVGPKAETVLPQLFMALNDRNPNVSEKASQALASMGERVVPELLNMLQSPNASVRQGAAMTLGLMDSKCQALAGDVFLPRLKSKDPFVRGEASMRTTDMGTVGVPIFLKVIDSEDSDLRHRALQGLAEIGDTRPEVLDALIRLLDDPQNTLRLKSSLVLGTFGESHPEVYKKVAPLLASNNTNVRRGIVRSLGSMGAMANPSIPALVFLLEESPDPTLREDAMESLLKMGTTESVEAANRYTKDHYDRTSRRDPVVTEE